MTSKAILTATLLIAFATNVSSEASQPNLMLKITPDTSGRLAQDESADLIAAAKTFVDILARKDFAAAVAQFDDTMKSAMPLAKLQETWNAVLSQVGVFKQQGKTRTEKRGAYTVVIVTTEFQNAALDIKVVFDQTKRVAGLFFAPATNSEYTTPSYVKPSSFREQEVTVGIGEWALPGTLTLPVGAGPFPAVVLVHGSGPHDRDETIGPNKPFRDLAWGLASHGVAVLRYEKRSKQYATKLAALSHLTVREETVDDALAAVDLLRKKEGIEAKRVFVLGHSLGGMLVPRIGQLGPHIAGFIVLAGTTRHLEDVISEQLTYIFSLDGTVSKEEQAQLDGAKQVAARIKALKAADANASTSLLGAPASYWLDLRDFDRDGLLDLVVNLNGDGRLDLLIDHSGAFNIVTVALSRGDGHFDIQELVASNGPGFAKDIQNNIPTADGNPTNATIAGDLNGDGQLDLIVACGQAGGGTRAGGLAILPGSGQGKFLAPRVFAFKNDLHFHSNFSYAGNNDRSTALGDFNGDGKPDLITLLTGGEGDGVSGPAHLAEVLPGNGDATFGTAIVALGGTSGLGTGATAVRVADMNRDGKLDAIVTSGPAGVQGNQGTTATRIAYGVGNGTFTYAVELPPADPGYSIPNVIVADFNGDSAPDLAVLTTHATDCCGGAFNHIEVFLQQSGAFVRTAGYPATDLGDTRSAGIAAGDLDGDGHTDLIAAGLTAQQANQLFFFHGNNNGTFQAPVAVGAITLGQARIGDIRALDLNHDNIPDIVATGFGGVGVYLGTGNGQFQTPVLYGSGGGGVAVLDVADLDGDGNPDLALGSTNGFTILRGIGDGTFANASYFAIGYLGARYVRVGDLNSDGKPDLVVGHDGSSAENLFATVLVNNYPAVQFSAANYNISEAGPSAVVTVTRTGDTSAGCAVNYTTSDTAGANQCNVVNGIASSRCDYITTLGTLTFAPKEVSKSVSIPIVDDLYVEGPETFTITLSNPNVAILGSPSSATVTIVDNDTVNPTINPIDDASIFVRQHYIDFLNREPDSGGLNFWTNEITSCGSNTQCIEVKRINVSAAFFLSIEFQETGYEAYCTYKSAFGNLAGAPVPVRFNDFLRDTQELGQGVQVGIGDWQGQLEANKQAFALAFVQRPEFLTAYPDTLTATQVVTQMDSNAGSVLSPTEKANLIAVLGPTPADVSKRAMVLRSVSENSNLRTAEFNRAFVLMEYFGYLRRNPNDSPDSDFSGFNFWLNKLNSFGGNFVNAEMVKAFILSGEYRHRFSPS